MNSGNNEGCDRKSLDVVTVFTILMADLQSSSVLRILGTLLFLLSVNMLAMSVFVLEGVF